MTQPPGPPPYPRIPGPDGPPQPDPPKAPDSVWVPGTRSFDPVNDAVVPALLVAMMWSFGSYALSVRMALFPTGQSLLQFVFFCFLVGVVGIAKIRSIKGNDAVSMPYVIGLAFAITVFVARFTLGVGGIAGSYGGALAFLSNLAIFAVVWAGVNWISRDCTVDPETEETASASMFDPVSDDRRRPGRSVVVFSLLAAMVFGLGQLILARANRSAYESGYVAAAAYAGSALLVLALTNLSGLRLYLSGRLLRTPSGMVGAWAALSLLLVAIALGTAWLIPRSGGHAGESILARGPESDSGGSASRYGASSGVGEHEDSRTLHPDRRAGTAPGDADGGAGAAGSSGRPGHRGAGDEGAAVSGGSQDGAGEGTGEREPGEGPTEEGQGPRSEGAREGDGDEPAAGQRGSGEQGDDSRSADGGGGGQDEAGGDDPQPDPRGQDPMQAQQTEPPPGMPELGEWADTLAKILLVLLGLAALVFLALFLIRALKNWWRGKPIQWPSLRLPWRRGDSVNWDDPFADPSAFDRLDARQQVLYSYGALMVLARRCGCPRSPSLTPLEYARNLPGPLRPLGQEAKELSSLYVRAEYGPESDLAECQGRVREIWDRMHTHYQSLEEDT